MITVVCTKCRSPRMLADSMKGASLTCAKCGEALTVPGGAAPPARPVVAPPLAEAPREVPPPIPVAPTPDEAEAPVRDRNRRREEDDEDDDRPRRRERREDEDFDRSPRRGKKKAGRGILLPVLLGVAFLLLAICGVGGFFAYRAASNARDRMAEQNHLKQVGIAFLNAEDASVWSNARSKRPNVPPHLSWRVAILPYVEQDNLFLQFHLDEPWDSEHNKKLIPLMPNVYASPFSPTETGKTYFKVFSGKGGLFQNQAPQYAFHNITDGTSNTILVAVGGEPVTWTKPDDFECDPDSPLPKINIPGKRGFNVLMMDGAVKFIPDSISEKSLRSAIDPKDGIPWAADQ